MSDEAPDPPERRFPELRPSVSRRPRRVGTLAIGEVLTSAFAYFMARPALYVGLTVVLAASQFLLALLNAGGDPIERSGTALGGQIAIVFASHLCGFLVPALCVAVAAQQITGERVDLGGCVQRLTARLGPLLGLWLAMLVLQFCGALLCGIGILFVLVIYWLVVPVFLEERAGVGTALSRSSELTGGSRWRVLAVILVLRMVPQVLATLVFLGVTSVAASSAIHDPLTDSNSALYVAQGIGALCTAVGATLDAIAATVGYYQLRQVREGVEAVDVSAVFD